MRVFIASSIFLALTFSPIPAANCQDTSVGFIPLTELGSGAYQGFEGGLYPGGVNAPPPNHLSAGLAASASVKALDTAGSPSVAGKIVLIGIGMSNTTQEFSTFITRIGGNRNPDLVIVDCAQGGRDVTPWSNPADTVWAIAKTRLAARGVAPAQVQVVWSKHAKIQPTDSFPLDAQNLQGYYEKIAENIRVHFPNVKLVLWSSRIYAGYASTTLNPEPYAYQSGFAVKWMIEKQINGDTSLSAPWMGWGPYLWADGLVPRAGDGLVWECRDFNSDGTHPSDPYGREKVAGMLEDFFRGNELTKSWFNAPGAEISRISPPAGETVSIFPNPFHSRVSIFNPVSGARVVFLDLRGKKVFEVFGNGSADLGFLSAGVYRLIARDGQGKTVARRALIKL